MATAFVRGLQEADPDVPRIATLKHFLGYSASDGGRNTEAAQLGERELREVHGTPFEMAIRTGGARGAMPSYNAIDGVPVSGSKEYLTHLLRDEFGFDGVVISDLGAVSQLRTKHRTAEDAAHALAQALRAGIDLDLDNNVSSDELVEAVRSGVVDEADLDRAVASVLRAKFRIGLFENPYVDIDAVPKTFDSTEERALARRIAEQSIVLLQNKPVDGAPLLPLSPSLRTIAVIGPNAHRPMGQLGDYSYQVLDSVTKLFAYAADPQARPEDVSELVGKMGADDAQLRVDSVPVVTIVDGVRQRAGDDVTVLHEPGCTVASSDRSGFDAAVRAATDADLAILVVGDQAGINAFGTVGEGLDSTECALPGVQRELVEAVVATGTPTVVVLSHGRPYVLGWMAQTVPAILTSFFGGEEAGNAVASVLFGDVNPAGRLPIAFLRSVGAAPAPYWRTLQGRAYVDGSVGAVFPFGHGLSYTTFEYRDLEMGSTDIPTDGVVRLSFTVANVGETAGDEVVQVYGQDVVGRTAPRGRRLVAFRRLHLDPGAGARVTVDVPTSMFALWDVGEGWFVEPGLIKLFVGGSSAAIQLRGEVTLVGKDYLPGPDRALSSVVDVEHSDLKYTATPEASTPDARIYSSSVEAVTATSTIRAWLHHPVGGSLLRAALGGPDFDEDVLEPVFDLPLGHLVALSQGQFPQSTLDALLAKVSHPQA
jgi:beta-glucosidase